MIEEGQVWECMVTPDDGEDVGTRLLNLDCLLLGAGHLRLYDSILYTPRNDYHSFKHCAFDGW